MNSPMVRQYSSPLRAEQAEATRRRILDAAIALLQDVDSGDVAVPAVAERAGVSVSTAYRAFPSRDGLLEAVLDDLQQRFADAAGAPPMSTDEVATSVGRAVDAVLEVEPLYRALFATPAGRELHRRTAPGRNAGIDAALAEVLTDLAPDQKRRFVALVHLLGSSRSVLFLKDYERLDGTDIAATVRWALAVLLTAVRDPEPRSQL